jgi:two-component system, chemotaxis family, CheB/CheR fusion protein
MKHADHVTEATSPLRSDSAVTPFLSVYDRLLDRYMPPSILVNANYELVHVFGGAEKYLQHRGRRARGDVLDLLEDRLKQSVRIGIEQASQQGKPINCPDICWQLNDEQHQLTVAIEPTMDSFERVESFLITFHEMASGDQQPQPFKPALEDFLQRHIQNLEAELAFTQSNLQAAVDALRLSHEESHAAKDKQFATDKAPAIGGAKSQTLDEKTQSVLSQPGALQRSADAGEDIGELLAKAGITIVLFDEELRVSRLIPGASNTLRLGPENLGCSVSTIAKMLATPDLPEQLQKVIETGKEAEFGARSAHGKAYLIRIARLCCEGVITGFAMAVVNAANMLQAENQLIFRDRAINAAGCGIVIFDALSAELPVIYVSDGFESLTGYSRDDAVGLRFPFLQGADTDRDAIAVVRESISHKRSCCVRLLNYKKSGEPFWNELHLAPVADDAGIITHFVSVQYDVTEQMDAMRDLRQSETNYRTAFENASVGVAQLDTRGRWVQANNRLCELLGYNRDELVGMTFRQLTDPEDLNDSVASFASLIRGEIDDYRCEARYHHRDGRLIWVQVNASAQLDVEGRVVGCIAVIEDISERRQAEITLQKSQRMALSANRAKSNFVANMSHELRTPMTAILGFADMLADEISEPEQLQKLQTLRRNGEYSLRLLDEILDLSKVEARRSRIDAEPCDFMTLIDEVELLMQGRAEQLKSEVIFYFPTQLPQTIYVSSQRIRRILVNLIANVLKFSTRNKVRVSISYCEAQHSNDEDDSYLEFEVTDSAEDSVTMRQQSLMPFMQADPAIQKRFAGRGSGLSITKRLVTALGGTIEVGCDHELGNSFLIRLPIGEVGDLVLIERRHRAAKVSELPGTEQLRCIVGRILVADDRRDVWKVTKFFLERCGAEVAVAEDGRQAVDAVRKAAERSEPFDLVLLDMQMPVMNGFEAIRELRQAGYSLPVIALTADAMKGERQKCIAAGCDDYLTKPIDAAVLTQTVAKYLGEKV